jgi:hypothetical protein
VLDIATSRNCFHISGPTQSPVFGLSGVTGQKVVTVSPGAIYIWLRELRYPDRIQRDSFISDLKKAGMLPSDFTMNEKNEGKNLSRKLEDLEEQEFSALLKVFSQYCCGVSVPAGN